MSGTPLAPEVTVDSRVTIVALGSIFKVLDEQCLENGLGELLIAIADQAEPPLLIIDLSGIQFFGSSFIELMFRVWNRLQARNGRFGICGLSAHCQDVLKVTHLDTLWPLLATRQDAVAHLAGV